MTVLVTNVSPLYLFLTYFSLETREVGIHLNILVPACSHIWSSSWFIFVSLNSQEERGCSHRLQD